MYVYLYDDNEFDTNQIPGLMIKSDCKFKGRLFQFLSARSNFQNCGLFIKFRQTSIRGASFMKILTVIVSP